MSGASLTIGNVEITALIDASVEAPCRALFPTKTPEDWAPYHEYLCDDATRLTVTISSFLVRSLGMTMLVDTGIGAKDRAYFPNGRLPEAIAEAGVRLDEIDLVLATHIHIDHVGWHTTQVGEKLVPTFPKSKTVFSRAEYEYWTSPDVAQAKGNEHVLDCVLPLRDVADIQLVDREHRINDEIVLLPTPGHTPAHTSIAIASAGEAGVIIGDVCHHPVQVSEGWSPIFDMNPVLASQSREALIQKIEAERMTVIAGHFPHPGFGRIIRVYGKRFWRGL